MHPNTSTETPYEVFTQWERLPQDEEGPLLDKQYVHKTREENVHIIRIDSPRENCVIAQVYVDRGHHYFFEHPQDHVPGMLLFEASRQISTAAMHLYYDVSFESGFVLNGFSGEFHNFADLGCPLFAIADFQEVKTRKGQVRSVRNSVRFIQSGQCVTTINAAYNILDKRTLQRMRQIRQSTEDDVQAMGGG